MASISDIIVKAKDVDYKYAKHLNDLTSNVFKLNESFSGFVDTFLNADHADNPYNSPAGFPGSWHSVAAYTAAFNSISKLSELDFVKDDIGLERSSLLGLKANSMRNYVATHESQYGIKPPQPKKKKGKQDEAVDSETTSKQDITEVIIQTPTDGSDSDDFEAVDQIEIVRAFNELKDTNASLKERIDKLEKIIKVYKGYFTRIATPEVALQMEIIELLGI